MEVKKVNLIDDIVSIIVNVEIDGEFLGFVE